MADSRYGRLFTLNDVLSIVDEALMAGRDGWGDATMPDILNELIERAEADKAAMTFPADEPLFLLRAQDKVTVETLAAYFHAAVDAGCDDQHGSAISEALVAFAEWQAANPDRVTVPN